MAIEIKKNADGTYYRRGQDGDKITKSFQIRELKAVPKQRIISGYANAFDVLDSWGDITVKGAFLKSIKEKLNRGKIKFLDSHGRGIGIVTKAFEDDKGLYIEAKISETPRGDEILILAQDGVMDEMSIGYFATKYLWDDTPETVAKYDQPVRFLLEIDLYEVSIVLWGANGDSEVDGVKDGNDPLAKINAELTKLQNEIKAMRDELQLASGKKQKTIDTDVNDGLKELLELTKTNVSEIQGGSQS